MKRILSLTSGFVMSLMAEETPPLNVVLIMADDLGPEMLGCYGATDVNTPNIDRLAREGTFFKTCWTVPVCGPSRVLLMTGRYGHRTGEWNMGDRLGGPQRVNPALNFSRDQPTFGKMLKSAGYATALAGKWQLVSPTTKNIAAAGFDEYCVWSIPFKEGFGSREVRNGRGDLANNGSRYWYPSIEQNGQMVRTQPADYGPDIYCNFLIDFMQRNKEKPLMLYFPMCLPHSPIGKTPLWNGEINDDVETIKRNVEYIDVLVGRIVDAVEKEGLTGRTVFIFTGDNGTELNGKNTPTDKGCSVPLIFKGPGIKAQGMVDTLTDFSDIMPTLASFAKTELPAGFEYDGHDLTPVLCDGKKGARDWIFSYMGQFKMARNQNWILECESEDAPGCLYYSPSPAVYVDKTDDPEADAIRRTLKTVTDIRPAPVSTREQRAEFTDYLTRYQSGDNLHAIPEQSAELLRRLKDGSFPMSATDARTHLFLLSGQSNMGGLDPEISFIPALQKMLPGDQIIFVKEAVGGQPIRRWYKNWKASDGNLSVEADGLLYDRLMEKARAAMPDFKIPDTITFVWMQGERDAKENLGDVYQQSLSGLFEQLAGDLRRDDINFVIGRLSDYGMKKEIIADWVPVRTAQKNVAEKMPFAVWVETDDLNDPKDGLHYNSAGYKELGYRFAQGAVRLINARTTGGDYNRAVFPDNLNPDLAATVTAVVKTDSSDVKSGSDSLIRNGGFETVKGKKPADWTITGNGYVTGDYKVSGNYAGTIQSDGAINVRFNSVEFPVTAGEKYEARWFWKYDLPEKSSASMTVIWNDAAGNRVKISINRATGKSNDFIEQTAVYQVPAGAVSAVCQFIIMPNNKGIIYFDDISFIKKIDK